MWMICILSYYFLKSDIGYENCPMYLLLSFDLVLNYGVVTLLVLLQMLII